LVPENSRLAAEEGTFSKKTSSNAVKSAYGVLVSSCLGPRISRGSTYATMTCQVDLMMLDNMHGFNGILIWFTWKRIPKTSQALIVHLND